jgi:type IV secretion system protein VirB11
MADMEEIASSLKERAKRKLERDLGPLLMTALGDPTTVEVMLNPDGKVWHERLGENMRCIGTLPFARAEPS